MAVPTAGNQLITLRASGSGSPPVRDESTPTRAVSVLFGTDIETWRRGWNRSAGSGPAREAIISASEPTRGAATRTQVVPDGRLAYTVLGTPIDVDRVIASVDDHLRGIEKKDCPPDRRRHRAGSGRAERSDGRGIRHRATRAPARLDHGDRDRLLCRRRRRSSARRSVRARR